MNFAVLRVINSYTQVQVSHDVEWRSLKSECLWLWCCNIGSYSILLPTFEMFNISANNELKASQYDFFSAAIYRVWSDRTESHLSLGVFKFTSWQLWISINLLNWMKGPEPVILKQYYEMSWERKNFTFHSFSSYIYVMTLGVTAL